MASPLTPEKRARRYLQASMSAGYSGLPAEQREAYESQMRAHEHAYSGVREHALAGADSDFDKPLSAGEREHQRALRDREGLQHRDVLRMRQELRGPRGQRAAAGSRRRASPTFAGPRAARRASRRATSVMGTATGGSGNTILYFIGVTLGLSLLYLLVAGKGSKAITGIVGALTAGVGAFIAPKDPISALEKSLGASGITSSASSATSSSSGAQGQPPATGTTTPVQSAAPSSAAPNRGRPAPKPSTAAHWTWPLLGREISAHRLTMPEVQHVERELLHPK